MGDAAHGEIVVKRHLEAVSEVRGFVRLVLGRWEMDDHIPCLVASELVTNAIRYGGTGDDDITVRLDRFEDGALWLEVQDTAAEPPQVREADATSESGRGLFIVEQVSER